MAEVKHYETDIAIIGSGGAGMAAGIEARDAGARVITFEMDSEPGGASIISGGGCMIVGTPLQEENGVRDTPDLAFDDWVKCGGPSVDQVWARYYIEHSLHDLYFWAEGLGVKWLETRAQEGNTVARWTRPEKGGLGLTSRLIDGYRARGGEIVPNTEITRIKLDDGRVTGVEGIDSETGEAVDVDCKTVLVSSGGFNSSLEMILEVKPDFGNGRILEGSGPGSTGSGHKLVRQVGGRFAHLDHIWCYVYATPDYRDPNQRRGLVFRMVPGYIWVNQQGRRFHNETQSGGNSASPALLEQTPRHAWAIVDDAMIRNLVIADPYYRVADKPDREKIEELLEKSPFVKKAGSLEDLANETDVDAPVFLDTVERYNAAFEQGLENEPEFGKPLGMSKKFDTPPYYAIQIFPLARKNLGGIKTDIRCRVLDKHFEPIRGLYAAGEAAGMAGGHINGGGALEGTMLGPSIFSGRVAGGWCAHEAGHGEGFVGKPNRD